MQLSSAFVRKLDKLAPEFREAILPFVEEIEESPCKSDFDELEGIVKELAEVQKRTELRVEELAAAQKHTEREVVTLTKTVKDI